MFTLPYVGFDPSFVPLFFDDIDSLFGNNTALKQKAIEVCGGTSSFTCLFDMSLTEDSTSSTESQSSLNDFEVEKKVLGRYCKHFECIFLMIIIVS